MPCGKRGVVEQAKPSAFAGRRVVPWRTDERGRHRSLPADHGIHAEQCRSGGAASYLVGGRAEGRVPIEVTASGVGDPPHQPRVSPSVHAGQRVLVDRLRLTVIERLPKWGTTQEGLDRVQALSALGMPRGRAVAAKIWMADEDRAARAGRRHGARCTGWAARCNRAMAASTPSGELY